jgi:alkanesulfonate monooxygenase SsuD/methylene tetrahydromethanopterin reductase-like flavin-dependent oxidoreductase (luciferase family)
MAPGGESIMPMLVQRSGTPQQVTEHLQSFLDRGVSDTIVLQLPTGDMTFKEAMTSLELFITEVIPALKEPQLV